MAEKMTENEVRELIVKDEINTLENMLLENDDSFARKIFEEGFRGYDNFSFDELLNHARALGLLE